MSDVAAGTATDEFDPWAGESGFKSDYDGVVTEAYFNKDAKYNNGQTLVLTLEVLGDDGEDVVNFYPCGPDWDSYDNGETAEHPKDAAGKHPKTFNHQTAVFGLMSHAIEAGAEAVLRGRGSPRTAAVWKGLKFHWVAESKTLNFKDRDGNPVERTTTRVWPSQFLGEWQVEGGPVAAAAPVATAPVPPAAPPVPQPVPAAPVPPVAAPAAPPAAAPPAAAAPVNGNSQWAAVIAGMDTTVGAKLKVLAKTKPYAEFIDAALAVDGVTTNDQLLDALGVEDFYTTLKS